MLEVILEIPWITDLSGVFVFLLIAALWVIEISPQDYEFDLSARSFELGGNFVDIYGIDLASTISDDDDSAIVLEWIAVLARSCAVYHLDCDREGGKH